MKNILIIAAVLVLLGGGYYLWQSPMDNAAPAPSPVTTNTEPVIPEGQTFPPGAVMEDGTIDEPMGDTEFHALVSYTEDGYSPALTTIKKGQTVRFVNNAVSMETWPASAVHPTHALYPEKTPNDCLGSAFDACRGLMPGEFWEFTFNEIGTWRFHDHLRASKTGSIVVE